ncbi:hypothetical protein CTAYLR_002671 [Chrysophaeum taylorii]|uniref:Uncharacterized protein n=1 Tax=Chrysophaeum taylorii TaxID=2483200 RepID=A0AAD7XKN8_9STRA|nr:hypothetical protein CTAYLR_002671 [Chrysophaeum taylorii]
MMLLLLLLRGVAAFRVSTRVAACRKDQQEVRSDEAQLKRRVRAMYQRARGELRNGRRRQGIATLEEACATYPPDAHSWLLLGRVLGEAGEREASMRTFERALVACPNSVHLAHAAGVASLGDGDAGRARRYFELALALEPDNAHARHSLARLDVAAGNGAAARRWLRGADASAALLVARCELDVADGRPTDQVVRELRAAAARLEEEDEEVVGGESGRRAEAARLERAAAKTTEDPSIAETALRRAYALDDASAKSTIALARFLLLEKHNLGDADDEEVGDALELLRSLVGRGLGGGVAHELLAKVESELENYSGAAEILREATRRWPRSGSLWLASGANARKLGDARSARKCLARAADLAADDVSELSSIYTTAALVETTNRSKAEALFAKAREADPTHGGAYAAHGDRALKKWRDPSAARQIFQRGLREVSVAPGPLARWAPTLWHAWANLETKQGNVRSARALLDKALVAADRAPRSARRHRSKDDAPLILHSLGYLELTVGRFQAAQAAFLEGARRRGLASRRASPFLLGAARARLGADGLGGDAAVALFPLAETKRRLLVADPSSLSARDLFAAAAAVDDGRDPNAWRLWAEAEAKCGRANEADRLLRAGLRYARPDALLFSAWADLQDGVHARRQAFLLGARNIVAATPALAPFLRRVVVLDDDDDDDDRISSFKSVAPRDRRNLALLLARWCRLELDDDDEDNNIRERRIKPLDLARAAVQADPACGDAHLALGEVARRAGRHADAEAAYDTAIHTSASVAARLALSGLKIARRDFDAARTILDRGIDEAPRDARLWHAAAQLEARLGNLDGLAKLNKRARRLGQFFWRRADDDDDNNNPLI